MLKKSNKTTKKSANKQNFTKEQIALLVLTIYTGILTLVIIFGGFLLFYVFKVQQSESGTSVKSLIMIALDGISTPAPIDAPTGKVYIPQKKLVFPASEDTFGSEIRYYYMPASKDFPEDLGIVNSYGVMSARTKVIGTSNLEEAFESVPQLQACSRGYTISLTQLNDRSTALFTKTLSDGRSIWVYLDEGCTETLDDFEDYLRQVDSY